MRPPEDDDFGFGTGGTAGADVSVDAGADASVGSPQLPATAEQRYALWLAKVPAGVRSALADRVLELAHESYADTRKLGRLILAETLRGAIPVEMAPLALEFLRFELETHVRAVVDSATPATTTLLAHFEQVTQTQAAIRAIASIPMNPAAFKQAEADLRAEVETLQVIEEREIAGVPGRFGVEVEGDVGAEVGSRIEARVLYGVR